MTTSGTTTARAPNARSAASASSPGARPAYGRVIGALFLAGFVVYGGGFALVSSALAPPGFLATMPAHQATLVLGAFLMLLNMAVDLGKGVLFFPILAPHGERTALGYLVALVVQVVLLGIGAVGLLMLVPLSRHGLDAGGVGPAWATAMGAVLIEGNAMAYQVGQATLGVGGAFMCALLLRARLLPRPLATWGVIGYAIHVAGAVAEVFGLHISLVLLIPGGLFELALGLWLLAKGFEPRSHAGSSAHAAA